MKLIRVGIEIEKIELPEIKEEGNEIAIGFTKNTYKLIEKLQLDKDEVQSLLFTTVSKIFKGLDLKDIELTNEEINKNE